MEKPIVTEANYFSSECEWYYTGSSQIKSFMKCEAATMAKLKGEWKEETSPALLASSYIDAYFSGTLDIFKEQHPEMFKKDGTLYATYANLDDIIAQTEKDDMFVKYLKGQNQVIFTGQISSVPVKIKPDSFFRDKVIVDLKAIANFNLIWNEEAHCKENFIDYYDYILQAALYQEIVRQNAGKKLPFMIAAMTKEKISERAILNIPQETMDTKLEFLKYYLPHIKDLKEGKIEPVACRSLRLLQINCKSK